MTSDRSSNCLAGKKTSSANKIHSCTSNSQEEAGTTSVALSGTAVKGKVTNTNLLAPTIALDMQSSGLEWAGASLEALVHFRSELLLYPPGRVHASQKEPRPLSHLEQLRQTGSQNKKKKRIMDRKKNRPPPAHGPAHQPYGRGPIFFPSVENPRFIFGVGS
ncbi:unnamed protein product [Polarella glacialis]|uniref:Uncharacterized protein n=1 Tax=Polarella glacialis TaxID=89957 RepID=A0A813L511_POLGL|nr:unnamed protein product [Polarella glacialis]CAE8720733.1 unnamed protein product [Polarella glacialis]